MVLTENYIRCITIAVKMKVKTKCMTIAVKIYAAPIHNFAADVGSVESCV